MLAALAAACGRLDKMTDITTSIDKLDKIGLDRVKDELSQKGLSSEQITIIENYLSITGTNSEKLDKLKALLGSGTEADKGLAELRFLLETVPDPVKKNLVIDFKLARGLNYYTGIIFEVQAPSSVKIGSIGGGGRYDDLTGLFGVPGIPGVGISFGVDRIYDVLEELNLFPHTLQVSTQVLFFNLGKEEMQAAFGTMQILRGKGIRCELSNEAAKFEKQFKYAEKKNIPFAVIIGSKEIETKTCELKNLQKGQQQTLSLDELYNYSF
jgi:histidyl-tRNA synthetase